MGRRLINRQYKLGSRAPSMQTITGDSGIANLSPYLTINGTTIAPTFLYRGADATVSAWDAAWGEQLTVGGTGSDVGINQPSLGNGVSDETMKFDSTGKYFMAGGSSYGGASTNDIVMEIIAYWDGIASTTYQLDKKGTAGYQLRINSSGAWTLNLADGVDSVDTIAAGAGAGQFVHIMFFADKSGSCIGYTNAVAGSASVISAVGDTTNTETLVVGTRKALDRRSDAGFAQVTMWQGAAWLDTHLQAAVALERFQKWSGIYPTKASGTAAPTYSRACSAYATKWNGTSYDLINCSAGLPRVDYVLDDSGTQFKGMLIEPQATNLLTHSNDIDTGWTLSALTGMDTGTTQETPASGVYYQGMIASTGGASHAVIEGVVLTADTYCFSGIFKAGSLDWVRLYDSTAGAQMYFDITNLTYGTPTGVTSYGMVDLGSGNVLVYMTYTATAANSSLRVYSAEGDGDTNFVGDTATVQTWLAFMQIELGNKPTSRIYTAGAAATRLADDLQYNGDNVTAGQGTVKAEFLVDEHSVDSSSWVADLHNSVTSNNYIDVYINTSNQPNFRGRNTATAQWWIAGSGDMADGDIKFLRGTWESNNAMQYINSALDGTPDTNCVVPTGIDEIYLGQDSASANQLNGRIRNFRIYGFASSDV